MPPFCTNSLALRIYSSETYAHQAVQAMMVVEPVRAEVLPVTMQQAVERTRVLQQEFQEAL